MDQIIRQQGNTVIIENKDTGEILATIGIQFFSIEFYKTTIQIVDSSKVNDVYTIQLADLYDEALNPLNTQALALASITNFLPPGGGGGASISTATLMLTGQTTSYRTGDDSDRSSEGRATDFFTLAELNPLGNYDRFTDEIGTQTYTDDIVIDWSTYNGSTVLGWYRIRGTYNDVSWDDAIDNSLLFTKGSYTTGWRLPNISELVSLVNYSGVRPIDYAPFNFTSNLYFWSSTTDSTTTTVAYFFSNLTSFGYIGRRTKTNTAISYRAIPCRTFTVTGTILT